MARKPRSFQECCELVGVSPNADGDELTLALSLRCRELAAEGYDVNAIRQMLKGDEDDGGPALAYNPASSPALSAFPARRCSVNAVTLLWLCLAGLLSTLYFSLWPAYGYKLRSFRANDSLVVERTGEPYATILEVSKTHRFPNGKIAPAYRLRLAKNGSEVWYPVNDVHYLCARH
ncbi:MAG: hypothetical protein V3U98_03780 [Acidobacteriota bacterium]